MHRKIDRVVSRPKGEHELGPGGDASWHLGGSGELSVPAPELVSSTDLLGRTARGGMLAGRPTRRYATGLEPVGTKVAVPLEDHPELMARSARRSGAVARPTCQAMCNPPSMTTDCPVT